MKKRKGRGRRPRRRSHRAVAYTSRTYEGRVDLEISSRVYTRELNIDE